MGLLTGLQRRSWAGEPPVWPFPRSSSGGGGGDVGQQTALAVPAVWNCVSLIAGSISSLPLQTFRMSPEGLPLRVTDSQLVISPGSGRTQSEWLYEVMVSVLLRGNAYGIISSRDYWGRPLQIDIQSPDDVDVKVDRDTGRVTYTMRTTQRTYGPEDFWHLRGMTFPGAHSGYSMVVAAAACINIDHSSRQFANDFFNGGGIPNGIVTSDQAISQSDAETMKARWEVATANRSLTVMGAGARYEKVSVAAEESQFLATQKDNLSNIARFFNLDPTMIGGPAGSSQTYANVEQKFLQYHIVTIAPWLKRLEDSFYPMLSQPTYVQFKTDALLRTDAETRARIHVQSLAGKWKTPTEVRFDENLPPMTPAQKVESDMVPLSITPLGGAKALPTLKELPGPPAAVAANDQEGTGNG